jgi:hypothetical protein
VVTVYAGIRNRQNDACVFATVHGSQTPYPFIPGKIYPGASLCKNYPKRQDHSHSCQGIGLIGNEISQRISSQKYNFSIDIFPDFYTLRDVRM